MNFLTFSLNFRRFLKLTKMRHLSGYIWFFAAILTLPFQSNSQGSITDGIAIFQWSDVTPPTWNINFIGVGTGDQAFAMGWYYRVAGDGQETPFPTPDITSYIGNVATFEWDDVSGRGLFAARLVTTLTEGTQPSGTVISDFSFTNLSGQALDLSVIEYMDVDKGGNAGADLAILEEPLTIRIDDNVAIDYCYFKAVGAVNFQTTSFNALSTALNDGGITNLNGSGLPFGPGDGTYGFQWNMFLSPRGSNSLISGLAANEPIDLAFPIPTLEEWALIVLSLLLLTLGAAFIRRQNKSLPKEYIRN